MPEHAEGASANPILVEVTRGETVESFHRGAAAVFDSSGAQVSAWGDIDRPIFPRSAIKPLQALPLIESGAADAFNVTGAELALACASHSGEPNHAATARRWLERMGLGVRALECGVHMPLGAAAARDMLAAGETPTAAHNNCSGKHAGMIATALHMGEPVAGYVAADHPVQQRVRQVVEEMGAIDLGGAATAIDGCSIPTIATPLATLARAMARFADPVGLAPGRVDACARVRAAMAAHPFLVGGTERFDTVVMETAGEAALVKTGAEGVHCAALSRLGLGVAVKIDDGARRASEVATLAVLRHLGALSGVQYDALSRFARPPVLSRRGEQVGEERPASDWL